MQKDSSNKITYFIKGMHCASCEVVIEKGIKKLPNVTKVNVSLSKKYVEIYSKDDKFPSQQTLNNLFSKLGYSFFADDQPKINISKNEVKKIFAIFIAFVIAFLLLEKTNKLSGFPINGTSSLFSYFVFGLLAGISSCAALVGGLLLTLSEQWNSLHNPKETKSVTPFIFFNVSRVSAFFVFGGLLGFFGSSFQVSMTFSTILSVLISLLMLIVGLQMLGIGWFKNFSLKPPKNISHYAVDESNFTGKYMPIVAGALTFFVPCGFTLIAQSNALISGSFIQGALILTAFSLGTLPVLALISFTSVSFHSNPVMARRFNLFAGMLITFFAIYSLKSQINVVWLTDLNPFSSNKNSTVVKSNNNEDDSGEVQLMQMEATSFEYIPREITIRAGVKTRWDIYNSGATGCSQAVYAKGLYDKVIYLKPGLNTVEFTPRKAGVYKISCTMGMVSPVTVYVE